MIRCSAEASLPARLGWEVQKSFSCFRDQIGYLFSSLRGLETSCPRDPAKFSGRDPRQNDPVRAFALQHSLDRNVPVPNCLLDQPAELLADRAFIGWILIYFNV